MLTRDDLLVEQSIYWTDKESGLQFKARPDAWIRELGCVIDLKTTADASAWAFTGSAHKYGYFLQAAMVAEAVESLGETMKSFIVAAVENDKPHVPGIYLVENESIDKGRKEFKSLAMKLAHCIDKNEWEDYGVNVLSMPKYAEYDFDE